MRYSPGTTLPAPPIVGQNVTLLPDGTVDPDHATDCGESCVAAVLLAHSGFEITPGCVRQAIAPGSTTGLTTGGMLARFLNGVGVRAIREYVYTADIWEHLADLRHHGKYVILLGNWLDPLLLHWVVAYQRTSTGVWVMEPWTGTRREYGRQFIIASFNGESVTCNLWQSW